MKNLLKLIEQAREWEFSSCEFDYFLVYLSIAFLTYLVGTSSILGDSFTCLSINLGNNLTLTLLKSLASFDIGCLLISSESEN